MASLFDALLSKRGSEGFEVKEGVYQSKTFKPATFEDAYLRLRRKEGRLYDDQTVARFPDFSGPAFLEKEWRVRRRTAYSFSKYLTSKAFKSVVEIGAGNGWLTHFVASVTGIPCLGLDINKTELEQAARVFGNHPAVRFYLINQEDKEIFFHSDIIVLAGSIQYFSNMSESIDHWLSGLNAGGEIHIIDSPLYVNTREAAYAKQRSKLYFDSHGEPKMTGHYFHHSFAALEGHDVTLMEDPGAPLNRLKRFFKQPHQVFPWIRIRR